MVKVIPLKLEQDLWEKLDKQKGDLSWEKFLLDNSDWDAIHVNLHAVRLINGYKPSEFEIKISKIITNRYKNHCEECKKAFERFSQNQNQVNGKKSFWDIFLGV